MHRIRFVSIAIALFALSWTLVLAQDDSSDSENVEMTEEEALIAHGEYIAHIAGCISCHSPYEDEYADFSDLTVEQAIAVSLFTLETLDLEERAYAGGRPFDLGPAGLILTRNITPHEETGIGSWTDEGIEAALRVGVTPEGYRLFPIMPYRNYFNMAEDDMQALIAFLRSIDPVTSEVPRIGPSGEGIAPELISSDDALLEAPLAEDGLVERGEYLVNVVMSCGDCHTPIDATTGAPLLDEWLSGGQPWEGPWGIVYGGNITPDEATGIGTWTDEEISRAIREGIRRDGRRLVLMPWEDYAITTDEDIAAVVAYLRSLPAIEREVPAPSIGEPFQIMVEDD